MFLKILLIIIGIFFLIIMKFFFERERMRKRISKAGGMEHRYDIIICQILEAFPNAEVSEVGKDHINITWKSWTSVNYFTIIEAFKEVMIRWQQNSSFGINKGSWDVKVNFDQMGISRKIISEIRSYE